MKTIILKLLSTGALLLAFFLLPGCENNTVLSSGGKHFDVNVFEQNIKDALGNQTVGYAYAINRDGQLVKSGDSGDARTPIDGEIDQSASKRMNIASVTKSITAVAVLQLLEKRGLTIDSLIAPWLPADWQRDNGVGQLTFKDLMTHTSGLNSVNANFNGTLSFQAMKDSIASGVVNPKSYNYLNLNYALFRVIIPALWKGLPGAPAIGEINASSASFFYRLYVQQEIFNKIGVNNADCVPSTQSPVTLLYTFNQNTPGQNTGDWSMICGGGGWYLSAIDLANFMANLRYTNILLSETGKDIMDDNFIGWAPSSSPTGQYGRYFGHGGSLGYTSSTGSGGMASMIMKFPINVEVTLVINSTGGSYPGLAQLLQTAFDNAWVD
jgi:CubicO group peptidase (beta-lactamase class C family)